MNNGSYKNFRFFEKQIIMQIIPNFDIFWGKTKKIAFNLESRCILASYTAVSMFLGLYILKFTTFSLSNMESPYSQNTFQGLMFMDVRSNSSDLGEFGQNCQASSPKSLEFPHVQYPHMGPPFWTIPFLTKLPQTSPKTILNPPQTAPESSLDQS